MAVAGLVGFAVTGDGEGLVRYGWGLLLMTWVVIALFWMPRLDVAEHEVTVVNVFSTVHVPWPAIERIDTKWSLTLYVEGRALSAWAVPAPNRYASQVSRNSDATLPARDGVGSIRPGDVLGTASGDISYVIRRHWEELRDDGLLAAGAEPGSVRREIHWVTIAVAGALAVATALGILL